MTDIFSKEKRSEVMSKIRYKDTKPEIIVRKLLFSRGFRFRLHRNSLPGKPDVVLKKYRTVIFVHGCFWHGHPCKIGSGLRRPKSNVEYWNPKIEKNIKRDKSHRRKLRAMGWKVIVIWECEAKKEIKLLARLKPLLKEKESIN